ncbi:uncharacterized protein LOC127479787 isoform X1 [Manacus candei]|uniref:uncharacterized protein LOC127479787 isoform X1 n=1 Tax=Manacus candei TaxID=415023 RepID=UPI0022269621|nr:uncharacterized protein LOC127479787 isoform X1 [Manacus candei]
MCPCVRVSMRLCAHVPLSMSASLCPCVPVSVCPVHVTLCPCPRVPVSLCPVHMSLCPWMLCPSVHSPCIHVPVCPCPCIPASLYPCVLVSCLCPCVPVSLCPCVRASCPCIPVSSYLCPCVPVSICPAHVHLCPCIRVSLYPCVPVSVCPVPVSLCPCIPVCLCPRVPVSVCPVPVSLYPRYPCPRVRLSCPCVPVSVCPVCPVRVSGLQFPSLPPGGAAGPRFLPPARGQQRRSECAPIRYLRYEPYIRYARTPNTAPAARTGVGGTRGQRGREWARSGTYRPPTHTYIRARGHTTHMQLTYVHAQVPRAVTSRPCVPTGCWLSPQLQGWGHTRCHHVPMGLSSVWGMGLVPNSTGDDTQRDVFAESEVPPGSPESEKLKAERKRVQVGFLHLAPQLPQHPALQRELGTGTGDKALWPSASHPSILLIPWNGPGEAVGTRGGVS